MLLVGRENFDCRRTAAATASAPAAASGGSGGASVRPCTCAIDVALPAPARLDGDRLPVSGELDVLEREVAGAIGAAGGGGKRGGEFRVVEGGRARTLGRIDEDELGALGAW